MLMTCPHHSSVQNIFRLARKRPGYSRGFLEIVPVAEYYSKVRETLSPQVASGKGNLLWWVGGIIAVVAGIGFGVVVGRRGRKRY